MGLNLSKLSDGELVELGRDTYGLTNAADMSREQLEESITSIHHGGETKKPSGTAAKPNNQLTATEAAKREAKNAKRRAARAAKKGGQS